MSAEATRKSEGESWDGAGSIAEPGNSKGSEDWLELSTWRSVVAGKCALRSALRIGATGSRWAVVPITGLSEAEQPWPMNKQSLLLHKFAVSGATRATRHSAQPLLDSTPHTTVREHQREYHRVCQLS